MRKQVLVIDDEADIRDITQMSLEVTTDWDIQTAASGAEGLAMIRDRRPDLVLLDVMMPDMDGQETCAQLKQDPATESVPVIFLTAKVQVQDRLKLVETGVKAIFTKPFDPTTLGSEISQVLGWQN